MDKKARKKKEREQKKKAARRQAARSPFERLDPPPQGLKCLINEDWFEAKVADILIRRELGGGTLAIGWFKVALDVAGLQLAQGMLDGVELDWEDAVADYSKAGKMVACPVETVRMLVEGGARIASEYGLRLPERWEKWARIYGPAGDVKSADLSKFDLGYWGTTSELRDRLIGSDVRSFVDRTDIEVDPEDDAGLFPEWGDPFRRPEIVLDDDDDDDDNYDGDDVLRQKPEQVLIRLGETPHPELPMAQQIQILAGIAAMPDTIQDMDMLPSESPLWQASVEQQLAALPPERQPAVREAFAQYQRYVDYLNAELEKRRPGEDDGAEA